MSGLDPVATFRLEARDLLEQVELDLLTLAERPGRSRDGRRGVPGPAHPEGLGRHVRLRRPGRLHPPLRDRLRPRPQGRGRRLAGPDRRRPGRPRPHAGPGRGRGGRGPVSRRRPAGRPAPRRRGRGPRSPSRPAAPAKTWRVRFSLPPETFVNGGRPLPLLDELRELGDCEVTAVTDAVPALEDLVPTDCRLAWDVVLTTDQPRSAIEDVFIFVIDDMTLEITEIVAEPEATWSATAFRDPKRRRRGRRPKPANDAPRGSWPRGRDDPRPGRAPGRADGSRRRAGHRPVAPQAGRALQQRRPAAVGLRRDRAAGLGAARDHDGRAHGADHPAVRPLPPPDPRPGPRHRQDHRASPPTARRPSWTRR
jgi:hypothetical protein